MKPNQSNQNSQKITFNYSNSTNSNPPTQVPQMQVPQMQNANLQQTNLNIEANYDEPMCFKPYQGNNIGGCYQNIQCENIDFYENENVGLKLLNNKQEDKEKKVVAVIVSFVAGSTYDELFTTTEQKSLEGTKVLVYSCGASYIPKLIEAFEEKPEDDTAKQLIENINKLDPDCVVFNWECSSNYYGENFPEGEEYVYKLLKMVLQRKFMAMFSDFSLKSLIKTWKADVLGPNPFKKIGETSDEFQLSFKNDDLKECVSAQLQIIGEMADQGKCHVAAMGGTILYSVDKHVKSELYDLKVLTIASNVQVTEENFKCRIGEKVGSAGHVLLSYKSGGHLLTSMGHWVELMKVDTSQKTLFEIAEREYGQQRAAQMKFEYEQMDMPQQKEYISRNAVEFVQKSAPCMNMASKQTKAAYKKKM